jgi:hypothetical protein
MMFFFGRKLQKASVNAVCVGTVVLAFLMACGAVAQSTLVITPELGLPYRPICLHLARQRRHHMNYRTHDGVSICDSGSMPAFLLDPLSCASGCCLSPASAC